MNERTEAALTAGAESYALRAHDDMHENGRNYVTSTFGSVQEYVDFKFEGEAEDEVKRLARAHDVRMDVAREAIAAALSDIHLGYLNEAFLEEFLVAMAKEDAVDFVDAFYDEEGFDPSDFKDWEHADGEVERRANEAGFYASTSDLSKYDEYLGAEIGTLIRERDTAEAA